MSKRHASWLEKMRAIGKNGFADDELPVARRMEFAESREINALRELLDEEGASAPDEPITEQTMKDFRHRAAEKAASRAQDEEDLAWGKISRAELTRRNGGGVRGARYVGPSERIQRLADQMDDD